MAENLPRIEFTIDEADPEQGIKTMSLVDEPAIQSDFVFFNKEDRKPKYVKLEKEGYKNTVFGAVLIPDKDILRVDDNGNPYNGYFSAETIESLRNKFHKEMQTSKVNEDHDAEKYVEAYLNTSYIIDSEELLKDAESKGLKDITLGTWVASYKVEDDETFQKVIDGELNGFSIEAFLSKEFKKVNNKSEINKLKIMKNKLIERLSNLIEEFSNEEVLEETEESVDMARASTVDGDMYEWGEVGQPVMKVITNDETQEETTEPVEEGDYEFEDGSMIKVDAEGNLVEFVPAPESDDEGESDGDSGESEGEDMAAEEVVEEVVAEETEEVVAEEESVDAKKSIEDLVDLSKDGYYTIEVGVEGGVISYGAVYANTWKELDLAMAELETLRAEKVEMEAKIEELNQTVLAEPVTDSTQGQAEEVDFSKMSNIEKIAYKNKINLK